MTLVFQSYQTESLFITTNLAELLHVRGWWPINTLLMSPLPKPTKDNQICSVLILWALECCSSGNSFVQSPTGEDEIQRRLLLRPTGLRIFQRFPLLSTNIFLVTESGYNLVWSIWYENLDILTIDYLIMCNNL